MKKLCMSFFAFVILALPGLFAQANKVETAKRVEQTDKLVKPIEAYAKSIEDFVVSEKQPHLIFAEVSDYNKADDAIWKKYASEEEFEKAREDKESFTIAYIWRKGGDIVAANFTYTSPSGDWAQFVFSVYRKDGSLAKVNRELRTFMGEIIVNRIHIYDKEGKLLKATKNFRELSTQKPIPEPGSFADVDADIHMKTSDLPFTKMIEKTKRPKKCD
jgi:hypothetical protein